MKNLAELADKVRKGFAKGKINVPDMELTPAEQQAVRREMRSKGYAGSVAFFICELCKEKVFEIIGEHDSISVLVSATNIIRNNKEKLGEEIPVVPDIEELEIESAKIIKRIRSIPDSVYFCATIAALSHFAEKGTLQSAKDSNKVFSTWFNTVTKQDERNIKVTTKRLKEFE